MNNSLNKANLRGSQASISDSPARLQRLTKRRKRKTVNDSFVIGLIVPTVLLLAWELCSRLGFFPPNLLPAPSTVIITLYNLAVSGSLFSHIGVTLYRVLVGFFLGAIVATFVGALTGYSRTFRQLLDPLLQALRSVPSLAW